MIVLIACLLILFCILIHAIATHIAIGISKSHERWEGKRISGLFLIALIVLIMFFASIIEATSWGAAYLFSGAIAEVGDALYFSIVTYTTLGYGDIVLTNEWRLLASFEAAIGIIIFGWSTAIVMAVVQNIYFKKK